MARPGYVASRTLLQSTFAHAYPGSQKHQGTLVAMYVAVMPHLSRINRYGIRTHTLQEKYPGYSIVATQDYRLNLLSFPMTSIEPLSPSDLITNIIFVPLPKNRAEIPGTLAQSIQYGGFKVSWQVLAHEHSHAELLLILL